MATDPKKYAKDLKAGKTQAPIDVGETGQALTVPEQNTALVESGRRFIASLGVKPEKLDPADADALIAGLVMSGDFDMDPEFVKLEPGDILRGKLVGSGATEINDKNGGGTKRVKTWVFADDHDVRVQILGAHQLDAAFADTDGQLKREVAGRDVVIYRDQDVRIPNGNIVARFRIGFGKVAAPGVERGTK